MKKSHTRSFELMYKYRFYFPGVKDMFILFGWFIVGALVAEFITFALMGLAGKGVLDDYMIAISYPIQFIPAMIYAAVKSSHNSLSVEPRDLDTDIPGKSNAFWTALAASLATISAAVVTEPLSLLLPQMPDFFKKLMDSMINGPLWVVLLCVSIFAPFFEEWLCRGIILRGLLSRMKPLSAILISAAFFAVLHLNPWQALPAFLLGCLFGLVYYKTGSLKLTMLMHCVNNTFSVLMSRMPGCEDCEYLWQLTPSMTIYVLIFCVAASLLLLFVVRCVRTTRESLA